LLGIPEALCAERLAVVARIADGAAAARAELVDPDEVDRELAEHRLDWLLLELDLLTLAELDAAREALLCVRTDGLELERVAGQAGSSVSRLSTTLSDAPDWLSPHLLGVDRGSLIGPLTHEDGHAVVSVAARHEVNADDGALRARAEQVLVDR